MNSKFLLLIFLFLFVLLPFVHSLELKSVKYEYLKNEIIMIDGNSESNVAMKIYATSGGKKIFDGVVKTDVNGTFEQRIRTDCSFPSGEYRIEAKTPYDSFSDSIFVKNSRECGFLTLAFVSPSPTTYRRTESFDVSVKITDSGKPINNAKVFFWDLDGKQQKLELKGNGIYSFESYKIPFNSKLSNWELMVTAIANTPLGVYGGENKVNLLIAQGAINVNIVKPKASEFSFGEPFELIINPLYPSGEKILNGQARIKVGEKSFDLKETSSGEYSVVFATDDLNNAVLKIDLVVQDNEGNSGTQTIALTPTGYWFWFLQRNAIFYIFPLLFVAYLVFLSYRQGRVSYKKITLEKKKTKFLELKKKLQDDYFNKSLISREIFNEQTQNLDSELAEIEQKLEETKKKQRV
ncbi:MAG: hypothetical protein Q7S21_06470 [archaeon]|nr:hypothetical protein [archaeon]